MRNFRLLFSPPQQRPVYTRRCCRVGLGDTSVVADVPHRSDVLQFGIQKHIRHCPHARRLEGQRHDGARVSTSRAEALGRRVRRAGIGAESSFLHGSIVLWNGPWGRSGIRKKNVYPYELCTDYHASEATLPGLQDATGTKADVDKGLSHPLLVCMSPLTLGMATRSPAGPSQPRREGASA